MLLLFLISFVCFLFCGLGSFSAEEIVDIVELFMRGKEPVVVDFD